MSVEEKLRILAERVKSHSSAMITEEAVKTAVILPFLSALDYDVFNPHEVIPEYTADAVGKKGEKVDYAIKVDGAIRILIECKPITTNLDKVHLAQLYRYFSVTEARFAILTNGRTFHFHTDLEAPNKLDERPFLTFDLSDLQGQLTHELKKFAKSEFNFVRLVTANLQLGRFTAAIREQFTPMVKTAFREIIRDSVQARLSTALADTEAADVAAEPPPDEADEVIATTEEEREGFMIVRAIVRDILKPARVVMRDQKSYCGILVDDNNRRPLARLHFNRSVRYIGLFDGEKEERVKIDTLDEIYEHAERLRATAQVYGAT